jgi:hypothetical protein
MKQLLLAMPLLMVVRVFVQELAILVHTSSVLKKLIQKDTVFNMITLIVRPLEISVMRRVL